MRKLCGVLMVLALLSGCASFSVSPSKRLCEPEQIWQAKAIHMDFDKVAKTGELSVAILSAPEAWVRSERSGTVSYGSNGLITVNRDAWRAMAILPHGRVVKTSALRGPKNRLGVLLPGIDPDMARSARIYVFSGLGTYVLNSEGREFGGEEGFDACAFVERASLESLADGKRSPLTVAHFSPETESGKAFVRALFEKFSERKEFGGSVYYVSPVENIERATNGVSSPDDYLFSNLSAFVTPGMGVVGAIEAVVFTGYGITTAKPQGPYREAKPKDASEKSPSTSSQLTREKVGDQ